MTIFILLEDISFSFSFCDIIQVECVISITSRILVKYNGSSCQLLLTTDFIFIYFISFFIYIYIYIYILEWINGMHPC